MTQITIQEAFIRQSKACASLGSPFMGQLMHLFGTRDWPDGPVTDRVFEWQGDISPSGQSVSLRMAGALHALHLQGHAVLGAAYPPKEVSDDQLWDAVCATLMSDAAHIDEWLNSAPQTNEVRRAATLISVGHLLADRYGLPLRTSELGASGGLNLHWDSYALEIAEQYFGPQDPVLTLRPEWAGSRPPHAPPKVTARAGVDVNPLDPSDAKDALRLQAYLWPDQPERMALTRAAIGAAKTPVTKGDAVDWLEGQLGHQPGQTHLIYSTVAWQYFPDDQQAKGAAMIAQAGETATADAPLAWFGMENDGGARGAALTLRLWPGDLTVNLGRADFHGRWVDWSGMPAA